MPEVDELRGAYVHGISGAVRANWMTLADISGNYFWSASSFSYDTDVAWIVNLADGNTSFNSKNDGNAAVVCVQ